MLDVLVLAPHPDDAELGCGGAIIKAVKEKLKVGIIDFTAGEMGSFGDRETRLNEAMISQQMLNISLRDNLHFKDGFMGLEPIKEEVLSVAKKIRQYQPRVVLIPFWEDRHPDHTACSLISTKAVHYAKLKKLQLQYDEYKVEKTIYYELNTQSDFQFIMDISNEFEQKKKAILSFKSQFKDFTKEYLPFPVEERCRYYGALINATYGEAFVMKNPIKVQNWSTLI